MQIISVGIAAKNLWLSQLQNVLNSFLSLGISRSGKSCDRDSSALWLGSEQRWTDGTETIVSGSEAIPPLS
ncbi:hypothetical protein NDA01_03400 [Trichocoleus desertorum AS-A10]